MKRGSIYWVNLEAGSPPEFGKVRPGLIVSNSDQNSILKSVVILPLSTQSPEIWPLRLEIQMPKGKSSFVVIPGIRQVSKTRLEGMITMVSPSEMEQIEEALSVYLSD